ncbi:MAG: T9SS type A sorting domain-containing protein [Prolixibacteraceae bacterium]|jgi:hypothetical protein|nr:T9SS type A sorting domain-containing protein [Prolixibacteraceae bacterium]MDI9563728.1 T9SS type A sorting domain-containing protein [Bacteroidota bacterium]NLS98958.1 T9SS type A sorting domain-containing protein [Bacteroidales bacterium]OQB81555.1 MAG: hypothetical protein BWX87_00536 [Bacteroidetes bacterium ADurb.Bin123]HNU77283.1 T9SS type A sorting domain-containing protein [Prolixibacteraceae bacterium]
MKKFFFLQVVVSIILFSNTCNSQEVVSSAGGSWSGTNIQLSWTVGESVIETFSGGTNILTQGFHQSKLIVTAIEPLLYPGLTLTVFPNPVSSKLILEVTGHDLSGLSFSLFDFQGKLVRSQPLDALPGLIDMESYVSGTYLLKLFREGHETLKTFKIVKN